MAPQFFIDRRTHNGISYPEFISLTEKYLSETDLNNLNEKEIKLFNYKKINLQRNRRIQKTFIVNDQIKKIISSISIEQLWMVITEDWCGDSAQNLPCIYKFSECNKLIDLKIIRRDNNLDIMDRYLTNGISRSIPKVISFDIEGNELFRWGPRPLKAQQIMNDGKVKGLSHEEIMNKIHLWYNRNKGEEITAEFQEVLKNAIRVAH